MATKHGKVVTYHEEPHFKRLHDNSVTWFCEVMWEIRYFTSPIVLDIKMVTLCEGHQPINSHNPLSMCSRAVTRQFKNTMSPLSQCLCSQDLPGWWCTVRSSQHKYLHDPSMRWSCNFTWLNTLYLHLQDDTWISN